MFLFCSFLQDNPTTSFWIYGDCVVKVEGKTGEKNPNFTQVQHKQMSDWGWHKLQFLSVPAVLQQAVAVKMASDAIAWSD